MIIIHKMRQDLPKRTRIKKKNYLLCKDMHIIQNSAWLPLLRGHAEGIGFETKRQKDGKLKC